MISVFELFKVGIGPSSSHTVGPMRAAAAFVAGLAGLAVARIKVALYGSLAWTGKGHGSDLAVVAGLAGLAPETVAPEVMCEGIARARAQGGIDVPGLGRVAFDPDRDLTFDVHRMFQRHPNALAFVAFDGDGRIIKRELWFSLGGGFVVRDGAAAAAEAPIAVPYPFRSAADLLTHCARSGLSIAAIQRANELALRPAPALAAHLALVADTMFDCIARGIAAEGELPGGLKVKRRAKGLAARIAVAAGGNAVPAHGVMDHVSLYAIAVNEENAAGGRVVTAPTNGAAGVVPAVLAYYRTFCAEYEAGRIESFLLTATAIGALYKMNASISGAEVGCQGEVGVASSMAAAALCAVLGGSPEQVENAAEIAMEHHLGMTCDPVAGLVQIPCIERNAFGAIKAINAAALALNGDGTHRVSLDEVIATMRQTGAQMANELKETSRGGLAVNVKEC